jgi:stage III sporulation protein AH
MKGKWNVKKLWKRNQIMITALALMIAIAGYLNFTGKQIDDEVLFMTSAQFEEADAQTVETSADAADETADLYDISDQDDLYYTEIESLDEDYEMTMADTVDEELAESDSQEDILSVGVTPDPTMTITTETEGQVAEAETEDIPGEAVFTNTVSITSLAEANLLKEQTRAQNKQALLDIINNDNVSEAAKQEAVNSMITLTDLAQKECDTLILLEAKGFPDAVVSINEDTVDVCIGMNELTSVQIAQIEDIVKRKTGIAAENIIISPVGE